jgi:formylmethanofuran dehydrogenase subunit E
MNALDLTTGSDDASRRAIDRIRSELGEAVAARVVVGERIVDDSDQPGGCEETIHRRGQRDRQQPSCSTVPSMSNEHQQKLTEKEITLRAVEMVQEMLKDTSTFLYSQGREHILQQAMEDGSSIICSNCGDMISRERWRQHAEYWCRELKSSDIGNDDGDGMET